MKLVPKIDKPCDRDWNLMQGDDKCRFCEHCQLHVHNLSAMTPHEQRDILSQTKERICVAYVQATGEMRVSRGWWLALQRLMRPWRAVATLWAAVAGLFVSSCASKVDPCPPTTTTTHQPTPDHSMSVGRSSGGKFYSGGFMPPDRPFWKRILYFWEW